MNYTDLASIPFLHPLGLMLIPFVIVILLWTVIIKGFALWRAARNGDKIWFVVLLVVNTIGILELLYLLVFSKKESVPAVEVSPETVT